MKALGVKGSVFSVNGLVEEAGGRGSEAVGVLGGEETRSTPSCDAGFHVGVTTEVVGKAAGYVLALGDEMDVSGRVLTDLVDEEGVVGAAEDDGVDERVTLQELVEILAYEIVGTGRVGLAVLDEGHPHRTCLTGDDDVWGEFSQLERVGVAADGSLRSHDADMAGAREGGHNLNCRTHYAEDVFFNGNVIVNVASSGVCVPYRKKVIVIVFVNVNVASSGVYIPYRKEVIVFVIVIVFVNVFVINNR